MPGCPMLSFSESLLHHCPSVRSSVQPVCRSFTAQRHGVIVAGLHNHLVFFSQILHVTETVVADGANGSQQRVEQGLVLVAGGGSLTYAKGDSQSSKKALTSRVVFMALSLD